MRTPYTFLGTLALGLLTFTASAAHLQPHLLFSAKMNGAQQVPANSSMALGLGGLTLNATRDTLCVNIGWTGLSSTLTGLHIHEGLPGVNGPVLVDLVPYISNGHVMATITGAMLTPELVAKHLRGELYLNLHTMNNPNGEIRGQIMPETDHAFVADLNGMQQVPMVTTPAFGLGTFLLARHNGSLKFNVVVSGLSGAITAAHFHMAAMGAAGPVVQDLGAFISGTTISGEVEPTAFLADLMAGNIYLNVHTAANPNGEIRGQLMMPMGIAFDATLNGAQEVPMVTTDGKGAASFTASYDMDSIRYDVVVDGLSGPIQAAHLHNAPVNVAGPVVFDLSAGINGNRITGYITSATQGDLIELLEGNLYINVHTMDNPNGEVRGQVYRYLREGYTIALDGAQQVPANGSSATGAGIVSVDRGQSNAHVMFVTNADMVQAAHFHLGGVGVNGPVLFDLSDMIMENGVFTYLLSTDATPFTVANSVQLRNDSLYLNVHTTAFPNGEVRGQVRRGAVCTEAGVGLVEGEERTELLSVFPVPVMDQLTIAMPADKRNSARLQVLDVLGSVVLDRQVNASATNVQVDVSAMQSGVYFVRLSMEGEVYTARFTKQ
jgi:Cu/Zn superoxide dismutase